MDKAKERRKDKAVGRPRIDTFNELWSEGSREMCWGWRQIWNFLFCFKVGDIGLCSYANGVL